MEEYLDFEHPGGLLQGSISEEASYQTSKSSDPLWLCPCKIVPVDHWLLQLPTCLQISIYTSCLSPGHIKALMGKCIPYVWISALKETIEPLWLCSFVV